MIREKSIITHPWWMGDYAFSEKRTAARTENGIEFQYVINYISNNSGKIETLIMPSRIFRGQEIISLLNSIINGNN